MEGEKGGLAVSLQGNIENQNNYQELRRGAYV
jgi:hypothetical protein